MSTVHKAETFLQSAVTAKVTKRTLWALKEGLPADASNSNPCPGEGPRRFHTTCDILVDIIVKVFFPQEAGTF